MMTEREICDRLYEFVKEGARSRRLGTPNKYPAHTIAYFLSSQGWLTEDLRMALMDAKPSYGREQREFEAAGGLPYLRTDVA